MTSADKVEVVQLCDYLDHTGQDRRVLTPVHSKDYNHEDPIQQLSKFPLLL